jgi:murein DD-endopeptidase MepM/ murein hydrolase activator NlpD
MKYWPVPNSYSKKVPIQGAPGSFWEDRGDRRHCGIDIYAQKGSNVVSIDNGKVIDIDIFTSPNIMPYWNLTKYIVIQCDDDLFFKYAELGDITVDVGQTINAGDIIGNICTVLKLNKISHKSPKYIQEIKINKKQSMLHFEVYSSIPLKNNQYIGGNWYGNKKPKHILSPNKYLRNTF